MTTVIYDLFNNIISLRTFIQMSSVIISESSANCNLEELSFIHNCGLLRNVMFTNLTYLRWQKIIN